MIHLITGKQGSGKTIYLIKKALEYSRMGKKVYSNVKVNFPFEPLDYNKIISCSYQDAIVVLDEIHILLSARKSLSKRSIEIVDNFLSMVRKKRLEVFGSTQRAYKVDVRFRDEADYVYLMERWVYLNNRWQKIAQAQEFPKDTLSMVTYKVFETASQDIIEGSFLANPYYELYDTSQVIQVKNLKI